MAGEGLTAQMAAAWQKKGLAAGKVEIELRKPATYPISYRSPDADVFPNVEDVQVKELKADNASLNIAFAGKPANWRMP